MHSLPLFEGSASLRTPLTKQRDSIVEYLVTNAAALNLTEGFNFVAHSQGALLTRAVIQALPESLRVINYVSMAGPQLGQWGMCVMNKNVLNSTIVKSMTRTAGWLAFYNPIAQREISVANYWNDPNHQWSDKEFNHFLPEVNNLVSHPRSDEFKKNFLRLKRAAFFGSSGDNCINPQLSSVFQFLDKNEKPVAMRQSEVYVRDTFGLATLDKRGGLVIKAPAGYDHMSWYSDPRLFADYVAPLLADW